MKVMAFNGNPNSDGSSTAWLLSRFLAGMAEAGAAVELIQASDVQVNPCTAGLGCWLISPGECLQDDDMKDLYPRLRSAEVWVIAAPVHGHRMAGKAQNFVDRLLPLTSPRMELRDGHSRYALRQGTQPGLVALVADCGLWEADNLDATVAHVSAMAETTGRTFAGALLRPHSWALTMPGSTDVESVYAAAREAGRQLAAKGRMNTDTLARVSRPLLPLDEAVEYFNDIAEQEVLATGQTYGRKPSRPGILERTVHLKVTRTRDRLSAISH